MANYLAREEDGTSHYLLEDGSGALLREEAALEIGTGECGVELEDSEDILELEDGSGLVLLETCVETTATVSRRTPRRTQQPTRHTTPPLLIRAPAAPVYVYAIRPQHATRLAPKAANTLGRAQQPTPSITITPLDAAPRTNLRMNYRAANANPRKLELADIRDVLEAARKSQED